MLANGVLLASQTLENNAPGKFFTVVYPIPAELARGGQPFAIRFQAHPGRIAGGVFDVRVVKNQ